MQSPSHLKAKSDKRLNNTNAILRNELCAIARLQMIACYNEAKLEFGRTGPRNEPGMNPLVEESLVLRRAIVLLSGGGKAPSPPSEPPLDSKAIAQAVAQSLVDKWGKEPPLNVLQCRADIITAFNLP